MEAVFVPVKLDEGFDFSLFLEDLSFELPLNLMLLRMRQQHPVVVRALQGRDRARGAAVGGLAHRRHPRRLPPLAVHPVGRGRSWPAARPSAPRRTPRPRSASRTPIRASRATSATSTTPPRSSRACSAPSSASTSSSASPAACPPSSTRPAARPSAAPPRPSAQPTRCAPRSSARCGVPSELDRHEQLARWSAWSARGRPSASPGARLRRGRFARGWPPAWTSSSATALRRGAWPTAAWPRPSPPPSRAPSRRSPSPPAASRPASPAPTSPPSSSAARRARGGRAGRQAGAGRDAGAPGARPRARARGRPRRARRRPRARRAGPARRRRRPRAALRPSPSSAPPPRAWPATTAAAWTSSSARPTALRARVEAMREQDLAGELASLRETSEELREAIAALRRDGRRHLLVARGRRAP